MRVWICCGIKCFTFHILRLKFHMWISSLCYFTSISQAWNELFPFHSNFTVTWNMIFHTRNISHVFHVSLFHMVNFACFAFQIQFTWYFTCCCPVVFWSWKQSKPMLADIWCSLCTQHCSIAGLYSRHNVIPVSSHVSNIHSILFSPCSMFLKVIWNHGS